MYFDHVHPLLPNSKSIPTPYSPIHSLSSLSQLTKSNWCCPHTPECRAIHWSVVNLPEATPYQIYNSFSPGNHKLLIAPQ